LDLKVKDAHINDLEDDLITSQKEIKKLDQRLSRQVLVDQNIEKNLQDELI